MTRATTKGAPLAADDIAGDLTAVSLRAYRGVDGKHRRQVSLSGAGVNMASVVALSASGRAIGTLTNPDGTYSIDGLPPGKY